MVRSTSLSPGAEMITFLAPACRCAPALALLLAALVMGAQHHASDPSEAVDGYFNRHFNTLLTALATFSGVKPKNLKRSAAGADSPKRSMPTTAPSRPTYFLQ